MKKLIQAFSNSNSRIVIKKCSDINMEVVKSKKHEYCLNVFYLMSGCAKMKYNGSTIKEITNGDFILYRGIENDYINLSGDMSTVILHAQIIPHGLYKDLVMCSLSRCYIQFLAERSPEVLPVASEMMKLLFLLKKNDLESDLLLERPIALFFILIYLTDSLGGVFTNCTNKTIVSSIMLDMLKNPEHPWKIKDMAKELNMNPNSFISEFRKVSGLTPFCFLKKIRLERARQLLINTNKPVSDIASECGYNSHASFTYYMKKEFGLTPLSIRKKIPVVVN